MRTASQDRNPDKEEAVMTFADSMAYIQSFTKSGAPVRDLSRIRALLDALGNPEKSLRFIHIAGTNGKGSTLAFSSAAAIAAGYKTGQFTSPYMICYNDRIRVNGENIPDDTLARLCTQVAGCHVAETCSQFEVTFAIALLYFVEQQCDLVFLETGLGGLLDATNIIEAPLVSVITSISLDHTAILGKTLPEIAAQKAGIIKQGCPVVVSPDQEDQVMNLLKKTALQRNAELRTPSLCDCRVIEETLFETRFQYHSMEYVLKMPGAHQIYNALTAIEIVRILGMHGYLISAEHVVQAFASVQVPARIQKLSDEPLILLDGGHNQASILALTNVLRNEKRHPVILICGMLQTKDYKTACHILAQVADEVLGIDDFAPDAVPYAELAACFSEFCETHPCTLADALPLAKQRLGEQDGMIVISGSLYLASHFLGNGKDAC
jgi:dihydrofolate synthase/folylpolyglutamate synthase